jgi:hypothetical protein
MKECDFCLKPVPEFAMNTRCYRCDIQYHLDRIADALELMVERQ